MNTQKMIEREEGRKLRAYSDTLGIWTIGVGHTGPGICANTVWTDAKVDDQYRIDEAIATAGCKSNFAWFGALNDERQAVLVGMAFQMGVDGLLAFTRTLAAVRDGRFADAQAGMLASKWAKQTPLRAERMARQMLTGVWST